MYIFNDRIKEVLEHIDGLITPLEPPYVQVLHGKHTTKQKLGRVLARAIPDDSLIKELVEEYKEINGNLEHYHIEHTTDYVGIYEHDLYAIDSTSRSCMTGENAVRVYGYDERLSLLTAYKNSKLVLRTLVRSDKMEYVRLYIDHNFIKAPIAKAIVAKAGYIEGDLEGIKLEYIECSEGVVCPYLDKVSNFDIVEDDYLIIRDNGQYDGSSTSGYVELEDRCTCDHCGDRVLTDDTYYINDSSICESCVDNYYVFYNGEYYLEEDCITNLSNNELIPSACIDYEDITCTDDGDWYNSDEVICIDDCYYHISDCKKLVQADSEGNSYGLEDDCIYNPEELDMLAAGYWLRGQIVDVLAELKETLDSLQMDLFTDEEVIELTTEEIDVLSVEISKIELLLK